MRSNIDLIKGLIVRIGQHAYSKKGDKKTAAKLIKNLRECLAYLKAFSPVIIIED